MKSIQDVFGALVVCLAAASHAMANDSVSPATVAKRFVEALQHQRFDDAAVMLAPEATGDGTTLARTLHRLGAELGGFSTMQPVARLPDGRSIRLEIPANHSTGRRFVQFRYASTAADGQAVFYEVNLSTDDRPPRLLSLAMHMPAPDAPSAERARAFLDRIGR